MAAAFPSWDNCHFYHTGWVFHCNPPSPLNFSTRKKTTEQPITAFTVTVAAIGYLAVLFFGTQKVVECKFKRYQGDLACSCL